MDIIPYMPRKVTLPPDVAEFTPGCKPGGWWHESDDGTRIVCDLCPRHCALRPGDRGFCFVRENRDGQVVSTTYGRSTGFCIDPIEKKPLNQFYPGTACSRSARPAATWAARSARTGPCRDRATSKPPAKRPSRRPSPPRPCNSAAAAWPSPTTIRSSGPNTPSTRPRPAAPLGVKTVAVTSGYITDTARAAFYEHDGRRQRRSERFHRRVLSPILRRADCSRCSIRSAGWPTKARSGWKSPT